jgi:hypothetical protein
MREQRQRGGGRQQKRFCDWARHTRRPHRQEQKFFCFFFFKKRRFLLSRCEHFLLTFFAYAGVTAG